MVWRVNKQTHKLEEFDPFCPKALAGIGALPGTLAHRAIAIEMQPPRPDDEYEDFDLDDVEYDSIAIRDELAAWAYGGEPALRDPALKPAKLPELDARSNEIGASSSASLTWPVVTGRSESERQRSNLAAK